MILEIKNLVKTFPGVKALKGVNFQLEAGEVHALLGGNGSGKSTVARILTGVYPKDSGSITFEGKPFEVYSPQESEKCGITAVYQEVNLLTNLTVAENIFMERQPKTMGIIKWKEINRRSTEILQRFDLNIDVTKELGDYSIAVQQMIAIARALELDAKVIILDEPTSSLNKEEAESLFVQLRKLKEEGYSIVLITHFLDQVYDICDKITVLRDGESIGMWPVEELPMQELLSKITGKDNQDSEVVAPEVNEELDSAENLAGIGEIGPYSMKIHTGEVVELAGFLCSGGSEINDFSFSITKSSGKNTTLTQKAVVVKNPRFAFNSKLGQYTGEKNVETTSSDLSVIESIISALKIKRDWFTLVERKEQALYVQEYLKLFLISCSSLDQKISDLSNEDQQMINLACSIASDPSLLMVVEPSCGIDLGAKAQEQKFIIRLSREESSIIFISTELGDVIRDSDSVEIMAGA